MRRLRAPALLFALAALAFHPLVLHPDETLYSDGSDLLAQHLPAKVFLVQSLAETGELPLWNPGQYGGSPFVHDIQIGLFYPPHLPLYVLGERSVGCFLSWLLFAHVVLAGWAMYAYGRHAGLSEIGAFIAAAGFMLSPRWMMQLFLAGHIVTQGIAWLPLVLLCIERSMLRKTWSWALVGSLAYAMYILGTHPQWTLYGSLLIAAWPLRLLPQVHVSRWIAVEAVVATVGIALCAVQLLPTLVTAGETSRAAGIGQSWSLDGAKAAAPTLVGPFSDLKAEPIDWETRGGIGYVWAILAIITVAAWSKSIRVPAIITGAMLAYTLGASFLVDRLPGFSSFRMPTRMLLLLAFPLSFIVAQGVDTVTGVKRPLNQMRLATVTIFFLGLIGGVSQELRVGWWVYWWVMSCVGMYLLSLLSKPVAGTPVEGQPSSKCLSTVLVLDLMLQILPWPQTKPLAEVFPPSPIDAAMRADARPGDRAYDPAVGDKLGGHFGPGSPRASVVGVDSVRGYNPLDVARYRQFLAMISDQRPTAGAFENSFTHPVVGDIEIRNRALFDLLGVRWWIGKDAPEGYVPRLTESEPSRFNFLVGQQSLPPLTLHESEPTRVFLVGEGVAPAEDRLAQLKTLDLRRTAVIEGESEMPPPRPVFGTVTLVSHRPNEVVVDFQSASGGWLVLTDPYFPGWKCRVDGIEVPIRVADHAFRGVRVPEGATTAVFTFEPRSFWWGKRITLATVGVVFVGLLIGLRPNRSDGRKSVVL